MTRWKASGIHFSISVLVTAAVAALIFYWYSPQLIGIAGGLKLLGIMVVVDLVLGPLLTMIIYNEKKRSLKFDLCVIAVTQLSALIYAGYVAYWARPIFVVGVIDRFELIAAIEVKGNPFTERALSKCLRMSVWAPCWVGFKLRNDPLGLDAMARGGRDEKFYPELYVALEDEKGNLFSRGLSGAVKPSRRILPVQGRDGDMIAEMLEESALPIDLRSGDPWKQGTKH